MRTIEITNENRDTVLAVLRQNLSHQPSWSAVRKLLHGRRISIGGVLCLDEARRLSSGEVITVHDQPLPPPPSDRDVIIHYVDAEMVIAEKPSGMLTLRRNTELTWSWERKNRFPTFDECVPRLIGRHAAEKRGKETKNRKLPKLFPVHRLDRDSSGLLVFARNKESQTKIIHQFAQHAAVRKYLAIIPGKIDDQTVTSQFIRDRGDGLRGSTTDLSIGESATTHFSTLQTFQRQDINGDNATFSELQCTLETGRTNQIRIHLAELGHPICGDIKYRGPFDEPAVIEKSGIQRMALHATRLTFQHPTSAQTMDFSTPWPKSIRRFLEDSGKLN